METYYTDKERKFVISAFRELRIALADDLSYPEIRRIEDIIKGGIAAGKAHRQIWEKSVGQTLEHSTAPIPICGSRQEYDYSHIALSNMFRRLLFP